MRYGLLSLMVLVFLTAACSSPCIVGSGTMVKEERVLDGFTGVSLEGSEHIIVKEGNYSVVVEGDDNLLSHYQTLLVGNQLVLRQKSDACITPTRPIIVYVTMPETSSLELSGSGNILTDSLITKDLQITVSGSGEVDSEAQAETITTTLSGSGKIVLSGRAGKHDLTVSGSGSVQALKLKAQQTAVTISGSGSAEVNAVEKLDATVSGSGDLFYIGSPDLTESITGTGTISQPE